MVLVAPGVECRGVHLYVGAARSALAKGRAHRLIVYKENSVPALQLFSPELESACGR